MHFSKEVVVKPVDDLTSMGEIALVFPKEELIVDFSFHHGIKVGNDE